MDETGMIRGFTEKKAQDLSEHWVNGGAYVMEPNLLDHIPNVYPVSLERQVFPGLVSPNSRLFGFRTEGVFVDIGTPEGYSRLQRELKR
jgi:mannose-1-phosphate guanylyltransferase